MYKIMRRELRIVTLVKESFNVSVIAQNFKTEDREMADLLSR